MFFDTCGKGVVCVGCGGSLSVERINKDLTPLLVCKKCDVEKVKKLTGLGPSFNPDDFIEKEGE